MHERNRVKLFAKCGKRGEKIVLRSKKAATTGSRVLNKVIKKICRERKYNCKLEAAEKKYEENLM